MSDEKKAMKRDEIRSRWHIYFVSAAIGTAVMILFGGVDRPSMNLVAQSLISLAAFMAAASGVLTSIYLGQVLRSVPEVVRKIQPSFVTMMEQSVKKNISSEDMEEFARARTPEQFQIAYLRFMFRMLQDVVKDSMKIVDTFMIGAKEIRQYGRNALYLLVVSALVSVFVILSGQPFILGLSIALIIFATWSIFQGWASAESAIGGTVWTSWFILSLIEEAKKQPGKT